jgi:hypothetical protein
MGGNLHEHGGDCQEFMARNFLWRGMKNLTLREKGEVEFFPEGSSES